MIINVKNQDFINATKALVTVSLTLAIIHRFSSPMSIYFALYTATCCALMQAGETKKEQLSAMLLAGVVFLFFLAFGLLVKPNMILGNIALVIFAFMTFYLPNLGINYKIPPVLGLVFYELVLSMNTSASPFWPTMSASAIGVAVAIPMYFLFWPYEAKHELMLLAQTLSHQYRIMIERYFLIARNLDKKISPEQQALIETDLTDIQQLLQAYTKLLEATTFKKEESHYFDTLYLRFYALLQINIMMSNNIPELSIAQRPLLQQLLRDFIFQFKDIEQRFDHMVPHSLIAKNLIGRSLRLGKTLTRPLIKSPKKSKKGLLTEAEFNDLLTQLIGDQTAVLKRYAFGLLRIRELITDIYAHQQDLHFNLKRGMFL
jgi:uncharacterized membrane protein YccC